MNRKLTTKLLGPELVVTTSRSGGPGGQNVNKVSSKVSVKFDVAQSRILTDDEKQLLLTKLSSRLTSEGQLVIVSQESRSQLDNKKSAFEKLEKMLERAFEKKKARKATKPTKGSVKKRIKGKQEHAEKKKWRQKPAF
jgi:ribosome-associated protein